MSASPVRMAQRDAEAVAVAGVVLIAMQFPDPNRKSIYALSDADERRLLTRISKQDRDALAELYRAYHRRLARFLTRLTAHPELVEEIINDVFFIVWKQAAAFRAESRVSTWLIGITYRRALKRLQRERANDARLALIEEQTLLATDDHQLTETHEWLALGLAQLPLEQRMVLELTYFMGRSCEEIAQIVGCPVNTVKTRLFHARRKLRQLLPALSGSATDQQC